MSKVAVAGIRALALTPVAVMGVASRHGFAAEVFRGAAAYDALLPEWQHLAELQPGTILVQTPTLLAAWARHFARGRGGAMATCRTRR